MVGGAAEWARRPLEMLRLRTVDVQSMISARYPLAEAERAFERANERGTLKVLVEG